VFIWQHLEIPVCLLLQLTVPGPPFVFGGFLVIMAMMVAIFMPVSPRIIIVRDLSKCDPPLQLVDRPTISSDFLGKWCSILYFKHVLHSQLWVLNLTSLLSTFFNISSNFWYFLTDICYIKVATHRSVINPSCAAFVTTPSPPHLLSKDVLGTEWMVFYVLICC